MTHSHETRYFYMAGGNRCGPYTFDEMLRQPIHRGTPVWTKGMSNWQTAGDVQELVGLIPPVPPADSSEPPEFDLVVRPEAKLDRYAKALRELNFSFLILVIGTLSIRSFDDRSIEIVYFVAAILWFVVLYRAARAVPQRRPWLWAIGGIAPLVGYVPLILLHNKLKMPLKAAGYRISFLGRVTPPVVGQEIR